MLLACCVKAQYEDETLQAMALSVIPEDDLQDAAAEAIAASAAAGNPPVLAQQDALARQLLLWFKRDFFSWVSLAASHHPNCFCSNGPDNSLHQQKAFGSGQLVWYAHGDWEGNGNSDFVSIGVWAGLNTLGPPYVCTLSVLGVLNVSIVEPVKAASQITLRCILQVNNPSCSGCGSTETVSTGMGRPSADDAAAGAGRVELYGCRSCGAITRSAAPRPVTTSCVAHDWNETESLFFLCGSLQ